MVTMLLLFNDIMKKQFNNYIKDSASCALQEDDGIS